MARYIQDIILNKPDNFVFYTMNDFFLQTGFVLTDCRGEQIYFSGNPDQEGCRCLKWSYTNGVLHLEAWLKGQTEGDEWNLDGLEYGAQKASYKQLLEQLLAVLQRPVPQQSVYNNTSVTPVNASISAQEKTQSNYAVVSMILGIISLVSIVGPAISIPLGIVAIILSKEGRKSSQASLANVGRICGIIGLIGTSLYIIIIILSIFWPW